MDPPAAVRTPSGAKVEKEAKEAKETRAARLAARSPSATDPNASSSTMGLLSAAMKATGPQLLVAATLSNNTARARELQVLADVARGALGPTPEDAASASARHPMPLGAWTALPKQA